MSFDTRWEDDVYSAGSQLNRYPYDRVVSLVNRLFKNRAAGSVNVVEVGFGAGNNIWFFAREGYRAHGIEGSATAVEFALKRLQDEGLEADLIVGDFTTLPWPDSMADFVLDRGAITHNTHSDIRSALSEVSRVLKVGGYHYSFMFSDLHQEVKHASRYNDGAVEMFTAGYFSNIGRTCFLSSSDLENVWPANLKIISKVLETHVDQVTGDETAGWHIISEKI